MTKTIFALAVSALLATPAFAKDPWFNGTYKGAHPAHKTGDVTAVFENNEPKSLTFTSQMGPTQVSELKLTNEAATWYEYDWTVATDLTGKSDSGQTFKAKLIADVGDTEQAVLVLPSGLSITLVRQP